MGSRVLVVDDEIQSRRVLEECLEIGGYEVVCVPSGQDGLDCLSVYQPDLVITDMLMPNMNGYEFSQLVREMSNVPIIMMTCMGIPKEAEMYMNFIDVILPKPIGLGALLDGVGNILSKSRPSEFAGKELVG